MGHLISRGDGRSNWIDRRDLATSLFTCGVTLLQDSCTSMDDGWYHDEAAVA